MVFCVHLSKLKMSKFTKRPENIHYLNQIYIPQFVKEMIDERICEIVLTEVH